MVEGWINSPGHRQNLLSQHARDVGVAIAKGPDKDPKFIAVQVFARPKSLAVEFQISNASGAPVSYTFGGETHELKPGLGVVHTACTPGEIVFKSAGTGAKSLMIEGRYEAKDGQVYTVAKSAGGRASVSVKAKERLR